MKQLIVNVDTPSIAKDLGIMPGFFLVSINGSEVHDIVDYEALSTDTCLEIDIETDCNEHKHYSVKKDLYEPLGLSFSSGLMSPVRQCANRCIFCFIDQMPHGNRNTLYFKDDDWRLSLIMGNYVTLTNVSDSEFMRILLRRVSPLYISVHATNGDVRRQMMRSNGAERILERLTALYNAKLEFHSQIVLCPGYNDGEVLSQTLEDLFSLRPYALSVAVVPVGLTKHRDSLVNLTPVSMQIAQETIDIIDSFSALHGAIDFAFASDEMYLCANRCLPQHDYYGEFVQIENGVGLFRLFESGFIDALNTVPAMKRKLCFDAVSGVSITPLMQALFDRLISYGITITVRPVENNFFGSSVTVSGLVTAGDIIAQYNGKLTGEALLIPSSMLREGDDVFLDGITLDMLSNALSTPVFPMPAGDGTDFIYELIDVCERIAL